MRNVRAVILTAALLALPPFGSAFADETAAPAGAAMMEKPMMEKGMGDKSTNDMSMSGKSMPEAMGDDEAARKKKTMMMMGDKAKPDTAVVR